MKLFKSIMLIWLPIAAMCLAMTACDVAEDETDCIVEMKIRFRFTKNDGSDYFGSEVSSLSVFAFDAARKFVGRWDEYDNSKFGNDYSMLIPLPPGDYSFVVWGGLQDTNYYLCGGSQQHGQTLDPVVGQTTMSELMLRLSCNTRNSHTTQMHYVDYIPTALFHGVTNQMNLSDQTGEDITIDLKKNSTQINLTIIGLPPSTTRNPAQHMDIYMESPNGGYNFWNDLEANGRTFTYVQHNTAGNTEIQTSSLYTLKMQYGNGHRLTIYNTDTGSEFYTADLLEDYIRKVPAYNSQDAVDAEDVFDITIDARSNLGVTITVNGWNVGVSGNVIQ